MSISLVRALFLLGVAGNGALVLAQSAATFTSTGSMTTPRSLHTATLLLDGRVLIAGGDAAVGSRTLPIDSAELYDPSTGAFASTGGMTTERFYHEATLLPDGRVLIIGGWNAAGPVFSAELYDPSTGTFTSTGDRTTSGGIPILLNNGKVFVAAIPNSELYDPSTGRFIAYPGVSPEGDLTTATRLADDRVLITGCTFQCDYADVDLTLLYDPVTAAFNPMGTMTNRNAPFERTATLLTNGKVLFAGGENEDAFYATAELYDPSTGTFSATGNMTKARHAHTATLLPDGGVLITGGALEEVPPFGTHASAERYGASAGTFGAIGHMTARRQYHRTTLLNDGRVLITGGIYWNSTPALLSGNLAGAELYTPDVLIPAPVLFSLSRDARGQGAIWHAATGGIASPGNPAVGGEVLSMYTTSLAHDGVIPPQVAISGQLAEILFFGNAPGYPGFHQVNFRMPSGVTVGPAIPVRLIYVGRPSNEVTIGVH